MASKKISSVRNSKAEDVVVDGTLAIGKGVTMFGRGQSAVSIPDAGRRLKVTVLSDIRDLYEGRSQTSTIWATVANMKYVTNALVDRTAREELTDFLLSRRLAQVVERLVVTPFVNPSDTAISKPQLFDALTSSGLTLPCASVMMELLVGPLVQLGFLSDNGKYARQESFPFRRVTARMIAHEVAVNQMETAMRSVNLSSISADGRQSKHVFAERVAEAFRPVGLALLQAAELSSIVSDIVTGVRAHIAPYGTGSFATGENNKPSSAVDAVPSSWRNHPLIAELATCLPFVRAALLMPSDAPLKLQNEGASLDNWIRIVVNYIRDSERYKWVSRREALRHYTTRKIRNLRGETVSVVANRSLKALPQAQAVIAIEDGAVMNLNALNINATKERIADVVQATYGSADLSTDAGAQLYADIASDLISLGYTGAAQAIFVDAIGDGSTLFDIAALLAMSLEVEIGDNGEIVSSRSDIPKNAATGLMDPEPSWDPVWWYTVATNERNLRINVGRHFGDVVLTNDPVEVLMAADEITAEDVHPAQPQLLSAAAFSSRVMGFDETTLQSIGDKFTFHVNYANQSYSGAFRAADFASLRSARLTRLVKPFFNDAVIQALAGSYAASVSLITEAGGATRDVFITNEVPNEDVVNTLHRRVAHSLLKLSQQLSPSFRREVHRAMIERVIIANSSNSEELLIARAQLTQTAFAAIADVTALLFFMYIQGIDVTAFAMIAQSPVMQSICYEHGSDRKDAMVY